MHISTHASTDHTHTATHQSKKHGHMSTSTVTRTQQDNALVPMDTETWKSEANNNSSNANIHLSIQGEDPRLLHDFLNLLVNFSTVGAKTEDTEASTVVTIQDISLYT